MPVTNTSISTVHFVLIKMQSDNPAFIAINILIDIFYPLGEPISLQSLRCNLLAVVHYSFIGHCLTFAAISTREISRSVI